MVFSLFVNLLNKYVKPAVSKWQPSNASAALEVE